MKINALTWSKEIYPRQKKSPTTIEAYQEAIEAGATFPPLEVQSVSNYPFENERIDATIILDGIHRWLAYQELNKKLEQKIEHVEVIEWKLEILDYEEHKLSLCLESAERNTRHGNRLKKSDKKEIARTIAEADPEKTFTEDFIAQKLGVAQQTVNAWVSDIRARQKASRDSVIVKLARLGWTQERIADVAGIKQNRVSQIINNTNFDKIDNLLAEGRTMGYIANHYHIDLALAWALRLDGKDDMERFSEEQLNWGLRAYDDWRFAKCDERFGDDWPGRIPAQLIAHILYFFTKQGDLVLDPMAGGGVVPDVCLAFERKCCAFDVSTRPERPEIEYYHWDYHNLEWPTVTKKPDLILFDPPYFSKKKKEYEDKSDAMLLSSLSREEYLNFFSRFFSIAHKQSKPTTRLALIMAPWRDYQSKSALEELGKKAIHYHHYIDLMEQAGWIITHTIDCPMSNARIGAAAHKAMQVKRELAAITRAVIIGKRS